MARKLTVYLADIFILSCRRGNNMKKEVVSVSLFVSPLNIWEMRSVTYPTSQTQRKETLILNNSTNSFINLLHAVPADS